MRLPWRKQPERRSYSSDILAAVFQQASTEQADAGKSAAVEAGAGYVARQFMAAEVEGPSWVADMLPPLVLAQIARNVMRRGASVWAVEAERLSEAAYWNFTSGRTSDRRGWRCQLSDSGPGGQRTRLLPWERVLLFEWAHEPAVPWTPSGPLQFASLTSVLAGNAEQALSHETNTPVGNVVEIPSDGKGATEYADASAALKNAAGRIWFSETLKVGDRGLEPDASWKQKHIGPMPTEALVEVGKDAFNRCLAAMGVPTDLFAGGGNSQGQREAARRCHLNLIVPLSRMIERELRDKVDDAIRLKHETYFVDMVGRSQVVAKLTDSGVALNVALAAVGLGDDR